MRVRLAAWTVSMLLALPVLGVDGVLEINQTCAVSTGCFAGDSLGFPVTIANAGSYVLTSNLSVTSTSADGIEITTDGVGLDLNGFEIAGPVTCENEGSAVSCTAGNGLGIDTGTHAQVSIRNGRVRGFASGVGAWNRALIRGVTAESNRLQGIVAGNGSIVSSSTAYRNGFWGIVVGNGAVVEGSTASANKFSGIVASAGSTIVDSAGYDNGDHGIQAGDGCVIRNSSAYQNEDNGIQCGEGCMVSDDSTFDNDDDGIQVGDGSTVQRSTMRANGDYGLRFSSATQATYRENTISGNTLGTVTGTAVNMLENSCNGATTCP